MRADGAHRAVSFFPGEEACSTQAMPSSGRSGASGRSACRRAPAAQGARHCASARATERPGGPGGRRLPAADGPRRPRLVAPRPARDSAPLLPTRKGWPVNLAGKAVVSPRRSFRRSEEVLRPRRVGHGSGERGRALSPRAGSLPQGKGGARKAFDARAGKGVANRDGLRRDRPTPTPLRPRSTGDLFPFNTHRGTGVAPGLPSRSARRRLSRPVPLSKAPGNRWPVAGPNSPRETPWPLPVERVTPPTGPPPGLVVAARLPGAPPATTAPSRQVW